MLTSAQLRQAAKQLRGAHPDRGDTVLAWINPKEAALLKAHGGSGKTDPRTGVVRFDSESGGEGPGAEGGGNGPGMGAENGGNTSGGTQGGNSVSGGANGMGVGGGNASGGANSGPGLGVSGADGTPSGASGVDQVGATQGLTAAQALGLTGRQAQMATTTLGMLGSMLGVPGVGMALSGANALSAHGVDQANNPGGNLSSGQIGGVGLGKGADTDPGTSSGGDSQHSALGMLHPYMGNRSPYGMLNPFFPQGNPMMMRQR